MGILEDFEQEFGILTAEITSKIGQLSSVDNDHNKRDLIKKISVEFEDCADLLEQIKLEIEGNTEKKTSHFHRLKAYSQELERLKLEFSRVKSLDLNAPNETDEFEIDIQEGQKQRLLDNSSVLEKTGRSITEGYRIALETEEISSKVLSNLAQQRETLQTSRNRLKEANVELGRSSRVINSMLVRHFRDKFLLYIVGLVFCLGVGLTIYFSSK